MYPVRLTAWFKGLALLWILLAGPLYAALPGAGEPGWNEFHSGNYKRAHDIWKPLAMKGDADAALGLAILLENGLGVKQDTIESAAWYQRAANQGNLEAQHDLGVKYYTGSGVEKNFHRAFELWKSAAESGLGKAQSKLGFVYSQGAGTAKNIDEAVRWYRQAIKQGDGDAMYNMSLLYRDGDGVRKDRHQFHYWLREAGKNGHARARYDLGLMLLHGLEMERSVSEGKLLLTSAANQGMTDAQYYLGTLYLNGHIVAPDHDKAMLLLHAAARGGHEGAMQTLIDQENLASQKSGGLTIGSRGIMKNNNKAAAAVSGQHPVVSGAGVPPDTAGIGYAGPDRTEWIMQLPADRYTIQILATQDFSAAEKFISRHPDINAFVYSFRAGDKHWHAVASGLYETHGEASGAIKELPANIRKSGPWVRHIGKIQELIRG